MPVRETHDKRPEHKGAGHRGRLRQRFRESGLDGFLDYEVIELLLTLGTPRKDCKDAAKAALARFKTFQGVLEAGAEELQEVPGIGPANCFGIRLAKAAAERYLAKKVIGKNAISNSRELFDYLNGAIRDKSRECFLAIFLDTKNRVLAMKTLFAGTLNQSSVYPREVIQAALQHRAAALIFAHNHPSGDPAPSAEDAALTQQLVLAGRVMGITVHEHLIMGDGRYFRFADSGRIARMNAEAGGLVRGPEVSEAGAAVYGEAHGR